LGEEVGVNGANVYSNLVGENVGVNEGVELGASVGVCVGTFDGDAVGTEVGEFAEKKTCIVIRHRGVNAEQCAVRGCTHSVQQWARKSAQPWGLQKAQRSAPMTAG
jgi:hypothetical protein